MNPNRLWLGFFGLWLLFLTGMFNGLIGGPGMIQATRLTQLLRTKRIEIQKLTDEITRLQNTAALFDRSRVLQNREIRRVLGYTAVDEWVFDFTEGKTL
jgi:hypothetical protein